MRSYLSTVVLLALSSCGVAVDDDSASSSLTTSSDLLPPDPGPPKPVPRNGPTTPPSPPGLIAPPAPAVWKPSPVPAACGSASDGITGDEYQEADGTLVWISGGFVAPELSPACPRPYLDAAATCGSYRLAVWDPVTGPAFGPWIRSCSTPQALAPSLKGWVHPGDTVWVEQQSRAGDPRATQFTIYM